eukprot:TRINITY_DN8452_c0_g3_i1.p1 TRINITY_DN8452_c0_g3~~TRINITY_DN8452_c0_g3_i1.p1  ORF type:complete len:613 (+),score=95.87 TRINITY_DN8452_c0_g3_i1:264-2102(+)
MSCARGACDLVLSFSHEDAIYAPGDVVRGHVKVSTPSGICMMLLAGNLCCMGQVEWLSPPSPKLDAIASNDAAATGATATGAAAATAPTTTTSNTPKIAHSPATTPQTRSPANSPAVARRPMPSSGSDRLSRASHALSAAEAEQAEQMRKNWARHIWLDKDFPVWQPADAIHGEWLQSPASCQADCSQANSSEDASRGSKACSSEGRRCHHPCKVACGNSGSEGPTPREDCDATAGSSSCVATKIFEWDVTIPLDADLPSSFVSADIGSIRYTICLSLLVRPNCLYTIRREIQVVQRRHKQVQWMLTSYHFQDEFSLAGPDSASQGDAVGTAKELHRPRPRRRRFACHSLLDCLCSIICLPCCLCWSCAASSSSSSRSESKSPSSPSPSPSPSRSPSQSSSQAQSKARPRLGSHQRSYYADAQDSRSVVDSQLSAPLLSSIQRSLADTIWVMSPVVVLMASTPTRVLQACDRLKLRVFYWNPTRHPLGRMDITVQETRTFRANGQVKIHKLPPITLAEEDVPIMAQYEQMLERVVTVPDHVGVTIPSPMVIQIEHHLVVRIHSRYEESAWLISTPIFMLPKDSVERKDPAALMNPPELDRSDCPPPLWASIQ